MIHETLVFLVFFLELLLKVLILFDQRGDLGLAVVEMLPEGILGLLLFQEELLFVAEFRLRMVEFFLKLALSGDEGVEFGSEVFVFFLHDCKLVFLLSDALD